MRSAKVKMFVLKPSSGFIIHDSVLVDLCVFVLIVCVAVDPVQQRRGENASRSSDPGVERANRQEYHILPGAVIAALQLSRGTLLSRVSHPTLQGKAMPMSQTLEVL